MTIVPLVRYRIMHFNCATPCGRTLDGICWIRVNYSRISSVNDHKNYNLAKHSAIFIASPWFVSQFLCSARSHKKKMLPILEGGVWEFADVVFVFRKALEELSEANAVTLNALLIHLRKVGAWISIVANSLKLSWRLSGSWAQCSEQDECREYLDNILADAVLYRYRAVIATTTAHVAAFHDPHTADCSVCLTTTRFALMLYRLKNVLYMKCAIRLSKSPYLRLMVAFSGMRTTLTVSVRLVRFQS